MWDDAESEVHMSPSNHVHIIKIPGYINVALTNSLPPGPVVCRVGGDAPLKRVLEDPGIDDGDPTGNTFDFDGIWICGALRRGIIRYKPAAATIAINAKPPTTPPTTGPTIDDPFLVVPDAVVVTLTVLVAVMVAVETKPSVVSGMSPFADDVSNEQEIKHKQPLPTASA